jgi:hypothetical protein
MGAPHDVVTVATEKSSTYRVRGLFVFSLPDEAVFLKHQKCWFSGGKA